MSHKVENITPYADTGDNRAKTDQVRDMFDAIAPAYDTMNRMMTLGIDRRWRHRCVDIVAGGAPRAVLDLATGTGDLAIALATAIPGATVTGADLSESMLEIGRKKVAGYGLDDRVGLVAADALDLPFDDNSFDAITIAFGVRNFEDLETGYAGMYRALRPGGRLVVLELTPPASPLVRPFYNFYTRCIIPAVGRVMSHDSNAYTYLPRSIAAVPARDDMLAIMRRAGFDDARYKSLTLGVATIYIAVKPPKADT